MPRSDASRRPDRAVRAAARETAEPTGGHRAGRRDRPGRDRSGGDRSRGDRSRGDRSGGAHRSRRQRARRVLAPLGTVLAALVVVVCAVGVLGTFAHGLPVLGRASFFVPSLGTRIVVLALAGGVLFGYRWWRRRRVLDVALLGLALLTAVGASVIVGRMTAAVERAGADVNLTRTLGIGSRVVPVPGLEITYGSFEGLPLGLTVYPAARAPDGSPAPVLVNVHGGGWTAGTRKDRSTDMRWFADRGWMSVSVDYALSGDRRHLWDVTEAQVGCALVWVAEHARDLGGDPTRLALTGDSTGANVALNVAYQAAAGTLDSSCGGRVPPVGAVSTLYPAVDPAGLYDGVDADLGALRRRMVAAYTGGSPEQFPDRYRRITPATHLGPASPPTLVITGEADHLVPVEGVRRFADEVRAAGAEVELVSVPYADFGFDLRLPGSIGQQAYRQLTLDWLRKHDRPGR